MKENNDSPANNLHLNSTLSELAMHEAILDVKDEVSLIKNTFKADHSLPGVIVADQGKPVCIIPKRTFFETLSKPFGLELFSKRTIAFLIEILDLTETLTISSSERITSAAKQAMTRPKSMFNDPILVEFDKSRYKILDIYTLIMAQTNINTISLQALKEANEMKTEMLSIAAHDLKNPLGTIIGLSKVSAGLAIDEDVKEMTMQIHDTAQHMQKLILELLNTSVIESGKMNLRRQIFDLEEIVSAIVYLNKSSATEKDQTLNYFFTSDTEFTVDGDALKLREAIENLVSNAIKYSPFGKTINVGLECIGSNIKLSVQDQGPGLTREDLQNLFGKFQRLSAQPTGGENSTGLGLYIAKQIVELHEGQIYVESEVGVGSTFIIELPLVIME